MSPFSFVRFGGRPAGRACSNAAISPCRAASYICDARATASGGMSLAADILMDSYERLLLWNKYADVNRVSNLNIFRIWFKSIKLGWGWLDA